MMMRIERAVGTGKKMSQNRSDTSSSYASKIKDAIETFLTKLRRGKFATRDHQSLSIVAARECAGILRLVVELFHEAESQPSSKSIRALKLGTSAIDVSTQQVATLLRHVTRAGAAMQRGSYFKLLLTNVTRRVLSILRDAATQSAATEKELEAMAVELLNDLDSSVETSSTSSSEHRANRNDDVEEDSEGDREDEDVSSSEDVEMETTPQSKGTFFSNLSKKGSGEAKKERGMTRCTISLDSDDSPGVHTKPNGTAGRKGDTAKAEGRSVTFEERDRRHSRPIEVQGGKSHDGGDDGEPSSAGGAEPSSLLSEFLSHTPPKTLLTRAPSTLGDDALATAGKEYPVRFEEFISRAIDGIRSFEEELAHVTQELCRRAARQLHDLDTVVTLGSSHSTTSFLLRATEDCHSSMFKVIILEGKPLRGANKLAEALRARGVEVRVLPDSSAFAVMSTCTKVIIGVENVLANGGLLAPIGTHPLCIAAKHFSVPVIVVTMTLKMTPYYPSDALCTSLVKISRSCAEELPWSTFAFPGDVISLEEWHHIDPSDGMHGMNIPSALMEYVPPCFVSLFATNEGEYTVPQIHRIVRDNYNAEDSHL